MIWPTQTRKHWMLTVAVSLASGVGALFAAGAEAGQPKFCRQSSLVHDFAAPLRSLPAINRVPKSGKLPFGPEWLLLERDENPVAIGRTKVGLQFGMAGRFRQRSARLGWHVTYALVEVDRSGRGKRTLRKRSRYFDRIDDVNDLSFFLPTKARPALYRFDLKIESDAGKRVSYSEYFSGVRRTVDVKLATDASSYYPGDRAYFRLENRGSSLVIYGLLYYFERWDGKSWQRVSGPPEFAAGVAIDLLGGRASGCTGFTLPPDLAAGRYRLSKSVSPAGGKDRHIAGVFDVRS